jgi:hypothetical protein
VFDPDLVTEVDLKSVALAADRTRVELEHRLLERFGATAEKARERIGSDKGWMQIPRSFATAAEATAGSR